MAGDEYVDESEEDEEEAQTRSSKSKKARELLSFRALRAQAERLCAPPTEKEEEEGYPRHTVLRAARHPR